MQITKSGEISSIKPPISIEVSWIIRLTSLEEYSSVFNSTEGNNKFELFRDNFDELSFEEFKEELEMIVSVSDITQSHLQHEETGPRKIQAYKK